MLWCSGALVLYLYFAPSYRQGRWHSPRLRSVSLRSFRADSQQRKTETEAETADCPVQPVWPVCLSIFSAHGTGHWTASGVRGQFQYPQPGSSQSSNALTHSCASVSAPPVSPTPSCRLSQNLTASSKIALPYHPSLTVPRTQAYQPAALVACSRPLLISRSAAHILLSDLKPTTILPLPPSPRGKQDAFLLWLLQIPICYFVCS